MFGSHEQRTLRETCVARRIYVTVLCWLTGVRLPLAGSGTTQAKPLGIGVCYRLTDWSTRKALQGVAEDTAFAFSRLFGRASVTIGPCMDSTERKCTSSQDTFGMPVLPVFCRQPPFSASLVPQHTYRNSCLCCIGCLLSETPYSSKVSSLSLFISLCLDRMCFTSGSSKRTTNSSACRSCKTRRTSCWAGA